MPPFGEIIRRSGVQLPQQAESRTEVHLGTVQPLLGDPAHSGASRRVLARLMAVRKHLEAAALLDPKDEAQRQSLVALSYDEYIDALKYMKRLQKQLAEDGWLSPPDDKPELAHFVGKIFKNDLHKPTFQGYLNYVSEVNPMYGESLSYVSPPFLDQDTRKQHTYVAASSGSGKTELLKALALHDIRQEKAATVIIDPTGNFAGAVARWPEFQGKGAERLVYINPSLRKGFVPSLNPLDAEHLDDDDRSILAGQLTDVFAEVVGKGDWTAQTETVASACFQVLVRRPGATLRDLRLALVERDRKEPLPGIAQAIIADGKRSPITEVQDFFTHDFLSVQYTTSKGSLRAKIANMLRDRFLADMTCLPSRIVLEKLLDERKTIIFDLGAWGAKAMAGNFGRLVIAQLATIGMRRSTRFGEAHTPMHIYVDEADMFMGSSVLHILSKLRQHGVHLTLAQQTAGYGFSGDDKEQLFNNTAIKFTAGKNQWPVLSDINVPAEAANGLSPGQFVGRWGRDGEPFRLDVRSDLLDNSRAMPDEAWEKVVAYQLERYYTPKLQTAADAPSDDTGETWPE